VADTELLVEVWRGPFLESAHRGQAVVCDHKGQILASWGSPEKVILPRSSCKMIQALPLIESGAADRFGLKPEQLALACASHQGAEIHTKRVVAWLDELGLTDDDLRCGTQIPNDAKARDSLTLQAQSPCQYHNNCSGKHTGFLTLAKYMNAGPEYVDAAHPVQEAVKAVFEDLTETPDLGIGIDGCSAPNFATTVQGLALAMAKMAYGATGSDSRNIAAARLVGAMARYPELVAGETRACTDLMRAIGGAAVVKTGAEGVFAGILPGPGLGIAVKIEDGSTRAAECALTALLVRLGVADPAHPLVKNRLKPVQYNRAGLETGIIRPTSELWQNGKSI